MLHFKIINNPTEEDVILFFKQHGAYSDRDGIHTVLNTTDRDYLDLIEMFEEFFTIFNLIKNPEDFDVDKYFYEHTFTDFIKWIFCIKNKNLPVYPPITIAHMIEVVKRKEWFEPE